MALTKTTTAATTTSTTAASTLERTCTCDSTGSTSPPSTFGATNIDAQQHRLAQLGTTHAFIRSISDTTTPSASKGNRLTLWKGRADNHLVVEKVHIRPPSYSNRIQANSSSHQTHSTITPNRSHETYSLLRQLRAATATTPHPHIAQLLDADVDLADRMRTLTEFCPLGDLYSLRRRHEAAGVTVTQRVLVHFLRQLAEAVSWLHSGPAPGETGGSGAPWSPIVHADIKPENVLLVPHPAGSAWAPNVKLADFDLAMLAGSGERRMHGCTEAYAAPEYPRASTKADVWGIGATVYFVSVGRAPRERVEEGGGAAATRRQFTHSGAESRLDERMPLTYDVEGLKRRKMGWSYMSGNYSAELAELVAAALEVEVERRVEAVELLGRVNKAFPPRRRGTKVPPLKRNAFDPEWVSFAEKQRRKTESRSGQSGGKGSAGVRESRVGGSREGEKEEEAVGADKGITAAHVEVLLEMPGPSKIGSWATVKPGSGEVGEEMSRQGDSGYASLGKGKEVVGREANTEVVKEEREEEFIVRGRRHRALRVVGYVLVPPIWRDSWRFRDMETYDQSFPQRLKAVWRE